MVLIRVLLGAMIALLVVIVVIPAVALLDLAAGGSGLGLCPTGLGACTTSAFTVMELLVILLGAAAILGGGIVGCLHLIRRPTGQQ